MSHYSLYFFKCVHFTDLVTDGILELVITIKMITMITMIKMITVIVLSKCVRKSFINETRLMHYPRHPHVAT